MTESLVPVGPCSSSGLISATPGACATASRTASSFAASVTTTLVGAFAPAGKLSSISVWPSAESTSSRKPLPLVRSLLSWVSPRHRISSTAIVPIQTGRGPRPTQAAIRLQVPCVSSMPSLPTRGMNGQKARRPVIARSAGRMVSIATIARPTPSAPIGPSPAVPLTSASERVNSAAITVPAEATIAGPALRIATRTASCLSSWRRSSSR